MAAGTGGGRMGTRNRKPQKVVLSLPDARRTNGISEKFSSMRLDPACAVSRHCIGRKRPRQENKYTPEKYSITFREGEAMVIYQKIQFSIKH